MHVSVKHLQGAGWKPGGHYERAREIYIMNFALQYVVGTFENHCILILAVWRLAGSVSRVV